MSTESFNRLTTMIYTLDSDNFNRMVREEGPFDDEFKMYNSEAEPLFETLIRRIIRDASFRIDDLEWLMSVSYNGEWACDLLESNCSDRYHGYGRMSPDHISYLRSIFDRLTVK